MRMTEVKQDILYVRMLGSFSIQWNGKLIAGGSKASESQLTSLLQILIHNRARGVPRDRLEELLFEDRDMANVHHALQSVIYNTKKKLQKAGLPPANYIEQRKGVFFWTEEIPLIEDATEFERLCREAEAEENPEVKIALYQEAAHWYTGEFLPNQTAVIWVAQEARRLKEMFCACVEHGAAMLRQNQDYFQLEELGLLASKIDPLADWETLTMEAMVSLGRYEEARQLYDDTVQFYFNEQGLRPSRKMLEQLERLGTGIQHQHETLDVIQTELSGLPGRISCQLPDFCRNLSHGRTDAGTRRTICLPDALYGHRWKRQPAARGTDAGRTHQTDGGFGSPLHPARRRDVPVWEGSIPGTAGQHDP